MKMGNLAASNVFSLALAERQDCPRGGASQGPEETQLVSRRAAWPRAKRKLAAIVAADVVGYSRLVGEDEEGTVRRLHELQAIVSPIVEGRGGRTVKTAGDAMLFDFSSIIAALECSIAVQQSLELCNAGLREDCKMLLRIGINVGDVIVERDDIFGEAVNIASRLKGIAEPGCICLSHATYTQCKGRLAVEFVDLGDQKLKNIAEPVRAYAVRPQLVGGHPEALSNVSSREPARRLSVVVLPFLSLGRDSEMNYFVDGLAETLATDLSKIPGVSVVARYGALPSRDGADDVTQIGKELPVRYGIGGSVQTSSFGLRINARLVDVQSGVHLWAERFDYKHGDLLTIQDEVATHLARELDRELIAADARRVE